MTKPGHPIAWLLIAGCCAFASPGRSDSYYSCRSCHGEEGLGSPAINAPPIAGQWEGYIARQLSNFRDGLRGAAPGDNYGRQMALMAANLDNDEIADLARLVAAMTPWARGNGPADTDSVALYRPCAACHGTGGEGDKALLSPRIRGMDPRYLARQLRHFRDGIRGTDQADAAGQTMRAALPASLDDAAIEKLAAYIAAM